MKELEPDRDLGKSTKVGCRNVVRSEQDAGRSFGCPTIRTDIPYKEKRSIADYNVLFPIFIFLELWRRTRCSRPPLPKHLHRNGNYRV